MDMLSMMDFTHQMASDTEPKPVMQKEEHILETTQVLKEINVCIIFFKEYKQIICRQFQ